VLPPQDFISSPNRKNAFFNVVYNGFDAYPQAMAAFQYAVDILSTQIHSSVVIEVSAKFQPIADQTVLGNSRPLTLTRDFLSTPIANYFPNTFYPAALANKLARYDLNPSGQDMELTFNSNNPNFYFGTDGNTPTGKFDFVSIVLHELIHGIGFYSGVKVEATGVGTFSYPLPVVYDRLTKNTSGLITANITDATLALGNHLTTNNLLFNGANATSYNNSISPKLYAPGIWNPGTSYVHWDEAYYPKGNVNSLLTPFIQKAEVIHNPGNVTKGLLMDMGWDAIINTGIEDEVYLQNPPIIITQTENIQYTGIFTDEPPYTTPITWTWELELYHSSGIYTHKSSTITQASNSNDWNFYVGYLPFGYKWQRDYYGNVLGFVKLKCRDSDGVNHYTKVQIGLKEIPDKPNIKLTSNGYKSATFTFFAFGASSYKIYYDTDAGHPYSGTQAIQGISGFSFISNKENSITLNNLSANTNYYITVKGINSAGESVYATEIICRPNAGQSEPGNPNSQNRLTHIDNKTNNIVYPNPANDYLIINDNTIKSVFILNQEGKILKSITEDLLKHLGNGYQIDVNDLANGVYILSYLDVNSNINHKKFVVLR
jgi:hypothetical protein